MFQELLMSKPLTLKPLIKLDRRVRERSREDTFGKRAVNICLTEHAYQNRFYQIIVW